MDLFSNENGLMMVVHAALVTVILYIVMAFVLKQYEVYALNRSLLAGSLVLVYMILFGHQFPPRGLSYNLGF